MALITAQEINNIAFISAIPESNFKTDTIQLVENKVKHILTPSFFDEVVNNQSNYQNLINQYIKPYMAFMIKAYTLQTIISDGGLSFDEVNSYKTAITSAGSTAQSYFNQLINHLQSSYGITRKIISGFTVS